MSEEIEISHCKRCGRKLTNKESITRGYGPTCYRASQQTEKKETENTGLISIGLKGDVDFLKCEVKMLKRLLHQFKSNPVHKISLDPIERIKRDENRPERNENKMVMGDVIRELKNLFNNGNFRELLKSIPANELSENKTLMECEI